MGNRYRLTRKSKKNLETRGYGSELFCEICNEFQPKGIKKCPKCGGGIVKRGLVCKICGLTLEIGQLIESKQQRRGKSKLYHAECYDKSMFISIYNGENNNGKDNGWKQVGNHWELEGLPRKPRKQSKKFKKKRQRRNKKKRKRRKERSK